MSFFSRFSLSLSLSLSLRSVRLFLSWAPFSFSSSSLFASDARIWIHTARSSIIMHCYCPQRHEGVCAFNASGDRRTASEYNVDRHECHDRDEQWAFPMRFSAVPRPPIATAKNFPGCFRDKFQIRRYRRPIGFPMGSCCIRCAEKGAWYGVRRKLIVTWINFSFYFLARGVLNFMFETRVHQILDFSN